MSTRASSLGDDLAFAIVNCHHAAGDLAVDRYGGLGSHGSKGIDIHIHIAGRRLPRRNRRGTLLPTTAAGAALLLAEVKR